VHEICNGERGIGDKNGRGRKKEEKGKILTRVEDGSVSNMRCDNMTSWVI